MTSLTPQIDLLILRSLTGATKAPNLPHNMDNLAISPNIALVSAQSSCPISFLSHIPHLLQQFQVPEEIHHRVRVRHPLGIVSANLYEKPGGS